MEIRFLDLMKVRLNAHEFDYGLRNPGRAGVPQINVNDEKICKRPANILKWMTLV